MKRVVPAERTHAVARPGERTARHQALVAELLASTRGGLGPIVCDGQSGCASGYPCGPDQPKQET